MINVPSVLPKCKVYRLFARVDPVFIQLALTCFFVCFSAPTPKTRGFQTIATA